MDYLTLLTPTRAFTLNSVPPTESEIVAGGIGRNFVSRDLLEATSIEDAVNRIRSSQVSVGHSYNLIDVNLRKILNVETASNQRISVHEIGSTPFFHVNMYLHLEVDQVHDQNSINRQNRAALLPKKSKVDLLSLVGDTGDQKYPIFMQGMSGLGSRLQRVWVEKTVIGSTRFCHFIHK